MHRGDEFVLLSDKINWNYFEFFFNLLLQYWSYSPIKSDYFSSVAFLQNPFSCISISKKESSPKKEDPLFVGYQSKQFPKNVILGLLNINKKVLYFFLN